MGDKNIKMQDTQKESQEKETEINDLKDKVYVNEQKITQMQLRLNELSHAIEQEENRILFKRNQHSKDDLTDEDQKKMDEEKKKLEIQKFENEKAHHFLKNMIDDLEILCWINQRDGREAEEKAYSLENKQKYMQSENEALTKKMIKEHEDNVSIFHLKINDLNAEFKK